MTVTGSGIKARTGAQTLGLLATPLTTAILHTLSGGPKRQVELRREAGSPAQSTLRSHLSALKGLGVVEHQRGSFPRANEYALTQSGTELIFVVAAVNRWLTEAPDGPLELGSDAGKATVKALVDGWSSTMLRALAAAPLSLTELDRVIGILNYPSLERRLGAMRLSGLVKTVSANRKGTPYAVTDWLRRSVGAIAVASRWERRHRPQETTPIGRIDAEAGLMLAMPLLRLPLDLEGSCRLVIELSSERDRKTATLVAAVEQGRVASCVTRNSSATAWAVGPPNAWFSATIEADLDHLEVGGDGRLARALLESLFTTFFGSIRGARLRAPQSDSRRLSQMAP